MLVQREVVEPHGTPEGDVGLLTVEDLIAVHNEQSGELCEDREHIDPLEEVDVDVRNPELIDELDVHSDIGIVRVGSRALDARLQPPGILLGAFKKKVTPPDTKIHRESHSELDIIHLEDLENIQVNADLYSRIILTYVKL